VVETRWEYKKLAAKQEENAAEAGEAVGIYRSRCLKATAMRLKLPLN